MSKTSKSGAKSAAFRNKKPTVDPDSARILQAVRNVMKQRQMTYVDLAYVTSTPPSTMYALLHPTSSGYGPLKISTIRMMAEGLDVSIAALLSGLRYRSRLVRLR